MIFLASNVFLRKTLPEMARCEQRFSLGKLLLAFVLAGGVILSSLLSVSPHLHELVHPDASTDHLCLATIFAGGQCESCASVAICVGPELLPVKTLVVRLVPTVSAPRFFTLLEHAPPALA